MLVASRIDLPGESPLQPLRPMFTDARQLPDQTRIDADLAIVGGGPAGITLALAFAGTGTRVCLVESGGLDLDPEVQALYEGENVGLPYPLAGNRLRLFGGSSNHWGGYCRPLDPIDFEKRDWVPHSGWPFGIETLAPYYGPAARLVEIAPLRFDDRDYWQRAVDEDLPQPVTGRMQVRYTHFSPPTQFGARYRDELERAGNIGVLLHANLVDIATTDDARAVTGLALRTLTGLSHSVRAKTYVLAAGALENARLLLLSNRTVRAGLGNQNDLVGRFFMEHPHLSGFGDIVVADLSRLPRIYRERVRVDGRDVSAAFDPSETFLRQRRLLNATFMAGVGGEFQRGGVPADHHAAWQMDMLQAAQGFIGGGAGPVDRQRPDLLGHWLGLGCACEQVPNPDSRVTLSDQRDALGLPRIRLDWRLTGQDRLSVVEHLRSLGQEFGALGVGRMWTAPEDEDGWPGLLVGGAHHMGTTRMHDDPRQGVVDRDARVHGTENLYIAGSSVFPTGGAANPTLTLVALTLRLADHLAPRLQ